MTAFSYFYYLFDSFTKFLQITHSSLQNEENMKVSSSLLGWFGFSSHALWLIWTLSLFWGNKQADQPVVEAVHYLWALFWSTEKGGVNPWN